MWVKFSSPTETMFLNMDGVNILDVTEHSSSVGIKISAYMVTDRVHTIHLPQMTKDQAQELMFKIPTSPMPTSSVNGLVRMSSSGPTLININNMSMVRMVNAKRMMETDILKGAHSASGTVADVAEATRAVEGLLAGRFFNFE